MSDRAAAARKAGLALVRIDDYLQQDTATEHDAEIIAQNTGYQVLRRKLGTVPIDLLKVLKDTQIPAYTWDSVHAYMNEMLEQNNQELRQIKKTSQSFVWRSGFSFLVAAASLAGMFVVPWWIGVSGALIMGGVGAFFFHKAEQLDWLSWLNRKEWRTVELKHYQQEIPEAIAARVAAVSRRLPEAQFKILELTNDPDPFLIVSYKGSDIVIGVWDEPHYQGEILG